MERGTAFAKALAQRREELNCPRNEERKVWAAERQWPGVGGGAAGYRPRGGGGRARAYRSFEGHRQGQLSGQVYKGFMWLYTERDIVL